MLVQTLLMLDLPLNFRLLILLIFIVSCGVKTRPVAPKSNALTQIEEEYQKMFSLKQSKEEQKKKQ
jgi:hypothetical protein